MTFDASLKAAACNAAMHAIQLDGKLDDAVGTCSPSLATINKLSCPSQNRQHNSAVLTH